MLECDGAFLQQDIESLANYNNHIMAARTVAFISLVWSENVRSYTSRSFDKPVWRNVLGNKDMQKAIVLAQLALYAAVLIPTFSDMILGLDGTIIGWKGWVMALAGPVACLVLCEVCKFITAWQMRRYQRQLARQQPAPMKDCKSGDAIEQKTSFIQNENRNCQD
mmetsp:Transcript_22463/g.33355  ORF Transcript_22463/g.33355 Transcript_22463/m.33355 type:complete len:165 (+) Transcript_22463:3-497(+)